MAADLLRSFWHSLEDPVVYSFQAEATTASSLPLCQSRLNRWMVGTDGSSMLEVRYRFYDNRTMTVFKSIKIHPPIVGITMCPRLYYNSSLDSVLRLIQVVCLILGVFTFKLAFQRDFFHLLLIPKPSDWNAVLLYLFDTGCFNYFFLVGNTEFCVEC